MSSKSSKSLYHCLRFGQLRNFPGPTLLFLLTIISIVFTIVTSAFFSADNGDAFLAIWAQSDRHPVPFTMSLVAASIFWIGLFVLQCAHVVKSCWAATRRSALDDGIVSGPFIVNNVLHSIFVILFAHGKFIWAEVVLLLNFANLSLLYFGHHDATWLTHYAVVGWPLAWTFVAIYWNGFIMVPHESQSAAQIVGGVLIWAIFGYGLFFLVSYNDFGMAICLSAFSISIGIGQVQRLASLSEMVLPMVVAALLIATVIISLRWPYLGRKPGCEGQQDVFEKTDEFDI